ncbi:hypothetical protein [Parageobacillus thermoglucosidasius]|uniref:hypothetical protein n=1 Tax=Parageobacillus thermoglucosidasius TaxID=1426 RepID=UPI003CC672C3
MSWIHVQSKTMHILLRKVMTLAGVLVLAITAFSLVNPNQAAAWLHPRPTTQYPTEGGKWTYGFWNAMVRSYYYHPDHATVQQLYTTANNCAVLILHREKHLLRKREPSIFHGLMMPITIEYANSQSV